MARKDRVSMDRHAQIIVLHERGYSLRRIAKSLQMCQQFPVFDVVVGLGKRATLDYKKAYKPEIRANCA